MRFSIFKNLPFKSNRLDLDSNNYKKQTKLVRENIPQAEAGRVPSEAPLSGAKRGERATKASENPRWGFER